MKCKEICTEHDTVRIEREKGKIMENFFGMERWKIKQERWKGKGRRKQDRKRSSSNGVIEIVEDEETMSKGDEMKKKKRDRRKDGRSERMEGEAERERKVDVTEIKFLEQQGWREK